MRESPPSSIPGPTLIFAGVKGNEGSFLCSCCGKDFRTNNPLEATHYFSQHQPRCACRGQSKTKRINAQ